MDFGLPIEEIELFKLYFEELKDIQKSYFAFEITMSLAIITTIGWFITSENSKKVLTNSPLARKVFLISIGLTAIAELIVVLKIRQNTIHLSQLLRDLNVLDKYFNHRVVSDLIFSVFYSFHLLLFGLLFVIVSRLRNLSKSLGSSESL